jgi:DNA-binding response OmpR family regulator
MTKIYLVEDDVTMLSLLQTLLALEGFQVGSSSGKEPTQLLNSLREEKPGLLILDVHLRQQSGMEILKRVRQDEQLTQLRIIMTSGMDMRHQCITAGADDFILKPYMPDDLIHIIRKQLSNEPAS